MPGLLQRLRSSRLSSRLSSSSTSRGRSRRAVAIMVAAAAPSPPPPSSSSPRAPAAAAAAATTEGPAAAASARKPPSSVSEAVDFSRIAALLLDIDGTLTDSDPLHLRAFQEALAAQGFNGGAPIDEAFYRERISGRHNPEIALDLLPHLPEAERVAFYEGKEARFREMARGGALEPMAGLLDFLAWAEGRGLGLAAVTNAPALNTELMLEGIGLMGRFSHVVLGERCARAKPHPDPYLEGARLLGLADLSRAFVVEDSPSGVRAGVAAGAVVVGIATSQPREVLLGAGACCVVESFEELLEAARAQGVA